MENSTLYVRMLLHTFISHAEYNCGIMQIIAQRISCAACAEERWILSSSWVVILMLSGLIANVFSIDCHNVFSIEEAELPQSKTENTEKLKSVSVVTQNYSLTSCRARRLRGCRSTCKQVT